MAEPSHRSPLRHQALTCALVEDTRRHGETLPTLIRCLNDLGIQVHLYASRRIRRDDPFVYCSDLVYGVPGAVARVSARWRHFANYDFVIFNTLERQRIMRRVRATQVPVIAVVHNGHLMTDPAYASIFALPNRSPLFLARHVAEYVAGGNVPAWIAPVLIGDVPRRQDPDAAITRFCVQGYLSFTRRNYASLLDATETLVRDGVTTFRIVMIGRDRPDGAAFRAQIAERGLTAFFEFSEAELTYRNFYLLVASTRFVLPLVDSSAAVYEAYYQYKLTSSLPISIGMGLVPVVERGLARLYHLEDHSIVYDTGHLAQAMRAALALDQQSYNRLRNGLDSERHTLIQASTVNLRQLLTAMGVLFGEGRT
jgi:hypothetical protein